MMPVNWAAIVRSREVEPPVEGWFSTSGAGSPAPREPAWPDRDLDAEEPLPS